MTKIKKLVICFIGISIVGCLFITSVNLYVYISTKNQISKHIENADCILVLGAGIRNNQPTPMLQDRLDEAISLYQQKKAPKLIMSGDHSRNDYNEVAVMKNYAIEKGVASTDIFMDHAGFSSYESIYRAKEIFEAKKIVIVTQKYHLYRSLYIANKLGIEAYGVSADLRKYIGQSYREVREILARDKDFVKCIFKPKSTYMGEVIPVNGDGDITNDKDI